MLRFRLEEEPDMKLRYILLTAVVAGTGAPAHAAVTVIGNTFARTCYDAAENRFGGTDALSDCDKALQQENLGGSDLVATYVNRGILKLRLANVDGAVADFDRAISLDPSQPEAYLNKGAALLKLPQGEERAVALFNTALEKKTSRPAVAYYGRAIAHELNGRINEAYRDYRQASALEPKWREPKAELARFTTRQQ
jgi:tetratricopeptide (TPR) repeat protein